MANIKVYHNGSWKNSGGGQPFTQTEKDKLARLLEGDNATGTYTGPTTANTEIVSKDLDPTRWYLCWAYAWCTPTSGNSGHLIGWKVNHSSDKAYDSIYTPSTVQYYYTSTFIVGGVNSVQFIMSSGLKNCRAQIYTLCLN